ncbi:carboxypeptidase-like regulatory domain-containing protein [Chryseobacterium chendengshani]|uniref:carboxypeptidase-like regulatory domain-containing protein n=1 Tax=Chryseobacterium sp. LJ668 TaxID=2864040 RepID=UPI001C68AC8F|nr:carboxypeptidase-like regulatory domain-containing protein [Chryseobacterium sp. LJ668]MBW8524614.1 carboxypeptidase-like regulatory domain-containing protein [Chryseobacterium sp. LJ668]QYK17337.1 carboxypeptidase-like regulatory domain-containing protein [Chryseobacterium sp. LJ668]
MKCKLLFILSLFFFVNINAQNFIFGKVISEENIELYDVTVINIRTDERVTTNQDGHFMISGRQDDNLRFIKIGYERANTIVTKDNINSPINIKLLRTAKLIDEVEIKKLLTGDLKIDTKTLNPPKKVEKLKSDLAVYIKQKSDPRILAARPGEFVQPKGQGFSIGKVKDKWEDVDLMGYLTMALGTQYFTDLKIESSQIQHFIYYVLANGFERKSILKYGFVSDADLMRFQRAVLSRISSYKAPQTQK